MNSSEQGKVYEQFKKAQQDLLDCVSQSPGGIVEIEHCHVHACLPPIQITPMEGVANGTGLAAARTKKQCTERDGAHLKLTSALTQHHQYSDGGCLNPAPIGNNELARLAGVSNPTSSRFLKYWFGGSYGKYAGICRNSTSKLIDTIKAMNGEFVPANEPNYGRAPYLESEID